MTDLTPDHPAVEAANMGVQEWLAGDGPFDDDPVRLAHDMTAACIAAALPHLTADDLRDTPAGRELIRQGIAAARNLEWMQPRMTPGGRLYNPAIPGDELRARREDTLAREAMRNMRESEQGRALMAEGWSQAVDLLDATEFVDAANHLGDADPYRQVDPNRGADA